MDGYAVMAETVGERIAQFRRALRNPDGSKVTQDDVANAIGVAARTVGAWERNERTPQGQNLVDLAGFLGRAPSEIMGGASLRVREGSGTWTPLTPRDPELVDVDLEGHPVMNDVEAILSWIPGEMSKRWAGQVGILDRLAEVYAYGSKAGWSADRLDFVHKVRAAVQTIQRRADPPPS